MASQTSAPGDAVGNGNGSEERPPGSSHNEASLAQEPQPDGDSSPPGKSQHHHANGAIGAASGAKGKIADKKEKIKSKTNPPGGFDSTPLPDAPPGYTVKFTFHKAINLPIADLHTHAADPFIHATLTADVPKRHKEDPVLTFRTRTEKRTVEPVWEQEWIVANIPRSGFTLKCRLYDEDDPDHNDRLGNVTITERGIDESWKGYGTAGRVLDVKKRSGSKRAYLFKAASSALTGGHKSITPQLHISIDVLGKSDPPYAQMYTVGPTGWVQHFSPMIGRLAGIKVSRDGQGDANGGGHEDGGGRTSKYDFQANEIQLAGPVPPKLYHRYVEFRPLIGMMFSSDGLRGRILNKALHKQHSRIYNFNSSTQYGSFEPRSTEASLQFLKMVHFAEGGRIFTYVLTLDGLLRFTETGREFGIDLLSKHTMHSDVATYIACSGEFFLMPESGHHHHHHQHQDQEGPAGGNAETLPDQAATTTASSAEKDQPPDPSNYRLIIDNDSGTYRPDKSVLPLLQSFLQRNLPGLHVSAMHCADEELVRLKEAQLDIKKHHGPALNMVLNRSPSASSFSSDDESRLSDLDRDGDLPVKSKKERAWEALEDPRRLKDWREMVGFGGSGSGGGESSALPHRPATSRTNGTRGASRQGQGNAAN